MSVDTPAVQRGAGSGQGMQSVPISEGTSNDVGATPTQRRGSRLPESALAGLREAFRDEVSERLPRLRAAATSSDPELLRDALRDVHTLGSSAYVVGEDDAARTARAAEAVLLEQRPLSDFAALVAELDERLAGWLR
jgi:HPt (histidine-containing phosphotransfer) domain-containing protein